MDGDLYREKTIIEQKVQVFLLVMTCCQIRPKQNKNINLNNSRNLVFARLQSIDGWKRLQKKFIWNQNGLQSLQKIWNELIFMFVIEFYQKIEYNALFMMIFIPVSNFGDQPLEKGFISTCSTYSRTAIYLQHFWTHQTCGKFCPFLLQSIESVS